MISLLVMSLSIRLVLCVPIEGQLIFSDGSPVANAEIVREWQWQGNDIKGSDASVTDENGYFHFAHIEHRSLWNFFMLPHSPSISVDLIAKHEEEDRLLFSAIKTDYKENSGLLASFPIKLECKIDGEYVYTGNFYPGRCGEMK